MSTPPAKTRVPPVRTAFGIEPTPIHILDIGAMAEGPDRYAGLLEQELATVTGFEPNPPELARLQALRLPRKNYLPYFLGTGGPATFHITQYPGCCSLYPPDPALIDLFIAMGTLQPDDNYRLLKTVPVETRRLDDLADLPPADFIKIDIQGAELDVLRSGTRTLAQVAVVEVEAEFVPLYKGQPLFGDLQSFLRDQGFLLHKLIDLGGRSFRPLQFGDNPYEPMSQLLFADAIFVRDFSNLAAWTDDQLLKAAAILYEVYRSHDLVHRLLTEYDRRRSAAAATAFTTALCAMPRIPTLYLNQKLHA